MHALKSMNDKVREETVFSPQFVDGGILFSIKAKNARSVKIAGDFNNWTPSENEILEKDDNGIWNKVIRLNPGLYQYKIIIDEKWISDPNNPIKVQSPFGGSNSVLVVR
jgi:1,4-alpha-glucan branching enzyme